MGRLEHIMPGFLTTLAASVLAGVMTLSATGCTTHVPEKPDKIPQVMWDLLWDQDQLKEADKTFYLNTYNGVDYTTYMFRSTNLYPLECDASGTDPADGYQIYNCIGKVPLPGTQYAPLLSPHPVYASPHRLHGDRIRARVWFYRLWSSTPRTDERLR